MVTAIYPDAPVKKGEQWIVTTNLESGMSADVVATYELTGMTGDYVLIEGTLIHDNVTNIAILNNLYSCNKDRNPLFKGGARGVVVNNYIYNPG